MPPRQTSEEALLRALNALLARAVEDVDAYNIRDGEVVSGLVAGWNFGDGHFHNHQLLEAVQEQCGFEEGELRCIFVESQPLGRSTLHYRIADAKTGPLGDGHLEVSDLRARPPWSD